MNIINNGRYSYRLNNNNHERSRDEMFNINRYKNRNEIIPKPCDNHFEKNKPCPYEMFGVSDQYLVLDSFHKLRESRIDIGEFKWNVMVQGVTGDEVIGVRDEVENVIELQVGSFCLPIFDEVEYKLQNPPSTIPSGTNTLVLIHNNSNITGAPTLIPNVGNYGQYPKEILTPPDTFVIPWINNPYTQIPYHNRLTIQVKEAGLQSYSDGNGARHHFEFVVSYKPQINTNPNIMSANPISGDLWDTYIFTEPIKDLHGITLVFRNPDYPVKFKPDCLYNVKAVSDGAILPGPFIRFDYQSHGLSMGDRIFISGFKSGSINLDSYINRNDGHVASGDPSQLPIQPGVLIPTANSFWLDPAVSIVDLQPIPILPQTVTVCIAKRRIRIPVRIRKVVDKLTNYITPF
jgi:hypothetical protein